METQESRQHELHRRLAINEVPWVILGYPAGITPWYSVYADDFQGGQLAAQHLISLDHKQIGIISADPRPSAFDERLRGFEQILKQNNLALNDANIFYGDMTRESGYRLSPKMFKSKATAFFALNDRMALGFIDWAHENDIRIPEEISIIGFDDIPDAASAKLTTIKQPAIEMGREAVNLLFRLLNNEVTPSRIVTPTTLIQRQTTK
jgi:DNA-binding LacI/PurR family transcriptional regulator